MRVMMIMYLIRVMYLVMSKEVIIIRYLLYEIGKNFLQIMNFFYLATCCIYCK